jgi:hypothetical protein
MDGIRNCVLINQENVWRICVSARKFPNIDGQGINTKSIAVQHVYYHENLDRKVSSYEERNIYATQLNMIILLQRRSFKAA